MLSVPNAFPNGEHGFKQSCEAVLFLSLNTINCACICSGLSVFPTHVLLGEQKACAHLHLLGDLFSQNNAIYNELFLHLFTFSHASGIRYRFIRL